MTETPELIVKGLHVAVEGKEILKGLDLEVRKGEIHALMGPNGSGKSTFANTMMGHPRYEVTEGDIRFKGQSVLELEPDERSRLGLFMAFQYPVAIPGVTVAKYLRSEEHTSELQSHHDLVCRLLLEKKKKKQHQTNKSKKKKMNQI